MDTIKVKTGKKFVIRSPRRLAVVAVALLGFVATLAVLYHYDVKGIRMRLRGPAPSKLVAAAPSADPDNAVVEPPQQRVLLLEDPVCKQPVDPARAQYVLEFGDKSLYFDRLECLNEFRSNPARYARFRVRVRVSAKDAALPPSEDAPLDPGGPPEPPTASASPADPSADTGKTESGPVGDTPMTLPPAAPPDPGPQPSPETMQDAPSVSETPESGPPSDVPAKLPADAPATGRKKAPAHRAKPHKSAAAPELPPEIPDSVSTPAGTPDSSGFSLPPTLNSDGPPSRKGAKKGRRAGKSADGAPSVDEPPPVQ